MNDGSILVTGAGGELGVQTIHRLAAGHVDLDVVAVDVTQARLEPVSGMATTAVVDLTCDLEKLAAAMMGCATVIHLAWRDPPSGGDDVIAVGSETNTLMLRNVLRAAELASVQHVVVVSSATVYGAWANAPLPISEREPLRPNPGFRYAEIKAEQERIVVQWRRRTGIGATVLRPAPAVADGHMSWLGDAVMNAAAMRAGVDDPPTQFLHLADLASAVALVATSRLDGPYNVAPDGWLSGADLRALLGPRPRVRLPVSVAERAEAWLARSRRSPRPAGLLPYTMHSWVVANDRLRRAGWTPESQNDEAFVEADQAPPWVALNARQRQYLSLGALGVLAAAGVALVAWLVGRRRRDR